MAWGSFLDLFTCYGRREKSLLEFRQSEDLLVGIVLAGRCDNELVIIVIGSLNDGDTSACECRQRFENAEYISVYIFSVRCRYIREKSVVDWIDEACLRMLGAKGSIYSNIDGFADERLCIYKVTYHSRDRLLV